MHLPQQTGLIDRDNKTDKIADCASLVGKPLLNGIHKRIRYLHYSFHFDPQIPRRSCSAFNPLPARLQ
jgi:hypothetical protein